MARTRWVGLFPLLGLLPLALGEAAKADVFFKGRDYVEVELRVDGKPLTEPGVRAAILTIAQIFRDGDDSFTDKSGLPGLEQMPWVDVLGARWSYQGYLSGGHCVDGRVRFDGIGSFSGFPEELRVAVFVPSWNKVCVTDQIKIQGPYCYLRADLAADGSGRVAVVKVLPWGGLDLLTAIALTLLVEFLVVIAYEKKIQADFQRKFDAKTLTDVEFHLLASSARLPICLGLCVVLNLLTMPVLWWFVSGVYQDHGATSGHIALAGAEMLAGLSEGLAYAWIARLGLRHGLTLGLIANAISFAVGLLI